MNSPSYCLQKMLWQYTYEIYINTLIAIIYFLSKHHLQGGDREQHSKTIALVISIHTPRKVVTFLFPPLFVKSGNFNPHHPQGGDQYSLSWGYWWNDFNPHHPQGGDLLLFFYHFSFRIFQSTPPARWWQITHTGFHCFSLFQSTPPARWWHVKRLQKAFQNKISIHTTRKVVTPPAPPPESCFCYFNPHHPQGGDTFMASPYCWQRISIHTTRKVVTP